MKVCGIDEAGRGSIIGPLVVAGVLIDERRREKLKEIGVKDSKLISQKRREKLAREIRKIAKIRVEKLQSWEIDAGIEAGFNLNQLEAIKMAQIINELKPDLALIDLPGKSEEKFLNYLKKYLLHDCELKAENFADAKYLEVGAASIIAKVVRDAELKRIEEKFRIELGVGYPHDERAIRFVERAMEMGGDAFRYIRKSWQTYKRIKKEMKQKKLRHLLL